MDGKFSKLSTEDFYKEYATEAKRLLRLKKKEVTSSEVVQDKLCPPENKGVKPKEYKYSASTAKDFLNKIAETGLGEVITGKTKKSVRYILPQKRPKEISSPVKRFLDESSLLVSDSDEDPKLKERKVE